MAPSCGILRRPRPKKTLISKYIGHFPASGHLVHGQAGKVGQDQRRTRVERPTAHSLTPERSFHRREQTDLRKVVKEEQSSLYTTRPFDSREHSKLEALINLDSGISG